MTGPRLVAMAIAVVSALVVGAAGIVAVWLTDEMRVFPLVLLPAVVATLLTLSFYEWQKQAARPRHRSPEDGPGPAEIA